MSVGVEVTAGHGARMGDPSGLGCNGAVQHLHLGGQGTKGDEVAGALGDGPWWGRSRTVLIKTKLGDYLRFHLAGISVPQPCSFSLTHTAVTSYRGSWVETG